MPAKHYSRKNIGYLLAIRDGASEIVETDDDNFPYAEKWLGNYQQAKELRIENSEQTSFNCYRLFTEEKIWPRGFPLHEINLPNSSKLLSTYVRASVIQGLADKDPDVDAIFRLTQASGEFTFKNTEQSYALPPGIFCPFNSQNTLWNPEAFPFMYLPVTVSFRYTDILRSFIAKRCLDQFNYRLAFAPATVYQERNEHDLYKDFADELDCYQQTPAVLKTLSTLKFDPNVSKKTALLSCYQALVDEKLVSEDELQYVQDWNNDISTE